MMDADLTLLKAYREAGRTIGESGAHEHLWRPNTGTCFCACGAYHGTQIDRLIPISRAANIYDTAICGCVHPVVHPALWETA